MAKNNKVTKKRVVKIEANGMAFVKASFNNVIVSLTNNEGVNWTRRPENCKHVSTVRVSNCRISPMKPSVC